MNETVVLLFLLILTHPEYNNKNLTYAYVLLFVVIFIYTSKRVSNNVYYNFLLRMQSIVDILMLTKKLEQKIYKFCIITRYRRKNKQPLK